MDLLDRILDLPVLIQGALGSFLFWALYELSKIASNLIFGLIGKFSKRIRVELATYEAFHHAHSLFPYGSGPKISAHLTSIHSAINRLIHALIYICIGVIASFFVGRLAIVAFAIALAYLFLALRAARVDSHDGAEVDHKAEFDRLAKLALSGKTADKSSEASAPSDKA